MARKKISRGISFFVNLGARENDKNGSIRSKHETKVEFSFHAHIT
jgi:hypothetical protein